MFSFGLCSGQDLINSIEIPPFPTAASLGRHGEFKVNHSSGTPSISVPIFNISTLDFNVPIQLNYIPGIRVNDYASWVGLGWSLSAGGVITRTVKGRPDDEASLGLIDQLNSLPSAGEIVIENDIDYLRFIVDDYALDTEPDQFHISIPSFTGKIMLASDGSFQSFPLSNLKIEFFRMSENQSFFILTDEGGLKYEFKAQEVTVGFKGLPDFISSWYLTKITTPSDSLSNPSSTIDFNYKTHQLSMQGPKSQTAYFYYNFSIPPVQQAPHYIHQLDIDYSNSTMVTNGAKKLESIDWDTGRMVFNSSGGRNDLASELKLDEIRLYSKDCKSCLLDTLKTFDFSYEESFGRFLLKNVREKAGNIQLPPYEFIYDLPSVTINEFAQDHWGYYNGENTNTNLIPRRILNFDGVQTEIGQAERHVSENHAQKFTLKEMFYPTGGKTKFYYESNKINSYENIFNSSYEYISSDIDQNKYLATDTIIISENYEEALITMNFIKQQDIDDLLQCCDIELKCATQLIFKNISTGYTQTILSNQNQNGNYELNLVGLISMGDSLEFSIQVDSLCSYNSNVNFNLDASISLNLKDLIGIDTVTELSGGLRIKKIENYDQNEVSTTKTFLYEDPIELLPLRYERHLLYNWNDYFEEGGNNYLANIDYECFILQSNSLFGQSNPVLYKKVTEINGTELENQGYSIFHFDVSPNEFIESDQYSIPISKNWEQGRALREEFFSNIGLKVAQSEMGYSQSNDMFSRGLKIARNRIYSGGFKIGEFNSDSWSIDDIAYPTVWNRLINKKEILISNGQEFIKTETYSYDSHIHKQISAISRFESNGETIRQSFKYPIDILDPTPAIQRLIDLRILNDQIESDLSTTDSLTQVEIKRIRKSYNLAPDNYPNLELIETSFQSGEFEEEIFIANYSGKRKPSEINVKGKVESIIWDYDSEFATAKVLNANSTEIAYTSFETDEKGGWNFSGIPIFDENSVSGDRIYDLTNGDISISGFGGSPSNPILVVFWAKKYSGGGNWNVLGESISLPSYWQRVERIVTTDSIVISGSKIHIDELRLHPVDAQMTTYVYKPQVGITDSGDVNALVTHYDFDDLGRLKSIKDHEGNILETYQYGYKNQ